MMTNRGITRVATVGWGNLTAPHALLLARDAAVPTRAINNVGEIDEYAGTGYTGGFGGSSRVAMASLAVSEDDSGNRAELTAAAMAFSSVTGPAPVAPAVLVAEEITDNAGSNVIGWVPVKTTGNVIDVTAASEANPAVLTTDGDHDLSTDDLVYIEGFAGGTWDDELNGKWFKVTVVDANEFSLQGVNSTAFGTATFATAKVYRPIPMNGATFTVTPNAEGLFQLYPQTTATV
jgi:hypothetical protein